MWSTSSSVRVPHWTQAKWSRARTLDRRDNQSRGRLRLRAETLSQLRVSWWAVQRPSRTVTEVQAARRHIDLALGTVYSVSVVLGPWPASYLAARAILRGHFPWKPSGFNKRSTR